MLTNLIVCLCLGINLHAGSLTSASSIPSNATTPSSLIDIFHEQLSMIASSCLTNQEHEQLAGGILTYRMARIFNSNLANEAQKAIGLRELRAVAGFAKPGPWTAYRKHTREEIDAATSVEEYYELREPRSEARSLDSSDFFEWHFPPAIAFLDARFAEIRKMYRHRFEAIRQNQPDGKMDRDTVDRMIKEYITMFPRVQRAISDMLFNDCELDFH